MFRRDAQGVLGHILGHIAFWCQDHELPELNSIVVNKSGEPGEGIPSARADINAERERVYSDVDCYDICPPTEAALAESYRSRQPAHRAARAQK